MFIPEYKLLKLRVTASSLLFDINSLKREFHFQYLYDEFRMFNEPIKFQFQASAVWTVEEKQAVEDVDADM